MSCKTINIDLTNVPPVPIQIGVAGENSFRTITFDASKWGADYPDATYTVVYRRSDGYLYPVLVNASADAIVWNPTGTDTAVSGNGQLEVRLLDGETIGKTIIMQTYVAPSLSGDESEPSTPAPDWVNDVADDADRAEAAVSHYPKIVNGVWFVWDATASEFVSTGISAQGEDGVSPTVTVEAIEGGHRVTITDADGAHTFDVMDGSGGSGGSADAVLYTEQTLTGAQQAQARGNIGAGTYTKPSGGIPKSDLASAVQTSLGKADTALQTAPVQSVNGQTGAVTIPIPTVPAMATDPDMEDWTSGKTVDAAVLKTDLQSAFQYIVNVSDAVDYHASEIGNLQTGKADKSEIPTKVSELTNDSGYQTAAQVQIAIAAIPEELPTVTASDNGKALVVENGVWAAGAKPLIIPVVETGTGTDEFEIDSSFTMTRAEVFEAVKANYANGHILLEITLDNGVKEYYPLTYADIYDDPVDWYVTLSFITTEGGTESNFRVEVFPDQDITVYFEQTINLERPSGGQAGDFLVRDRYGNGQWATIPAAEGSAF